MKLGIHMSMFCKRWTDDVTKYLEPIKAIGFDGVELSLYGADLKALNAVSKELNRLDLDVNCGIGITAETDISSQHKEIRDKGISFLKECINVAVSMGAKNLSGVLCAPWQSFSNGETRSERWKRSADCMTIIGSYAKQKGIQLNAEVLNRFESDFINTLEEGKEFLEMIRLPNVKLLADTFHMNIEENDMTLAVESNMDAIGYMHCCENHRGVPGTGHLSWESLFKVLKAHNYDGWLTIESFVLSGNEVGNALSLWRDMGREPIKEAAKGFSFLNVLRNPNNYVTYFKRCGKILKDLFEENCQKLCQLDAQAGDGDHGTTILRGITAAYEDLEVLQPTVTISECFKSIGYAMLRHMGGASGPIFSTLFIQASIVTKEKSDLVGQDLLSILEATENALFDLTSTQPGEKTMVDSIHGALTALNDMEQAIGWEEAVKVAERGSRQGRDATIEMIASKGRAKYLGERSKGIMDAGAMSCSLIFRALLLAGTP